MPPRPGRHIIDLLLTRAAGEQYSNVNLKLEEKIKIKINRFRKRFQRRYGDGHYFFACQAAFPIAFSVDMLYQLWANFKEMPEQAIEKAESMLPLRSMTIDRLAVSDLIQSDLCRRTDRDLFEMETEVRAYLLQQCSRYFPKERIDHLARFSFQYADRRISDPYYQTFRDTQRWVALARLAPEKAGEQLAAYYNLMLEKDNAAEIARLDALLEALQLMDPRFEDLREFSRAIKVTYTDQSKEEQLETARESFKKIVRIRSGMADRAGGLKVNLNPALRQQRFDFKQEISDEDQLLDLRMEQAQARGGREMDLSGMNLTGLPSEVFRHDNLEKLDLSHNQLTELPDGITELKNLRTLILDDNPIKELPDAFSGGAQLEELTLKNNRLEFLPSWVVDLPNLRRLDLRGNPIGNIRKDQLLFQTPADFKLLRSFFYPQNLGFHQPLVMLLITDPTERQLIQRALEPVVDSGQLHIEAPEEAAPWQLFRLFRQFPDQQFLLHIKGSGEEEQFTYGTGPKTYSVSRRLWKGIVQPDEEGRLCFLSSPTGAETAKEMIDLGYDCCIYTNDFQQSEENIEAYIERFYGSLGNGQNLGEAVASAEAYFSSPQQQMTEQMEVPQTSAPFIIESRKEDIWNWRLLEESIPSVFSNVAELKNWLMERLLSGGPGAIFTPLRNMLTEDTAKRKDLDRLQNEWEQLQSEEERINFYSSEGSPIQEFLKLLGMQDVDIDFLETYEREVKGTSWFFGIGISKHLQLPDIRNAVNDVREMQRTLEEKYELDESTLLFDAEATTENILQNLNELANRLGPADRLLIYYCGHTELDEKLDRGYWLPFDAEANRRSSYLDNNTLIDYLRTLPCKDLLLMVDGVFSGALLESGSRFASQSYAEPPAKVSRWGFVSGQDKGTVWNGPPPENSPFAGSILEVLNRNTEEVLEIEDLATRVTKSMMSNTPARQTPAFGPLWGAGHGEGEYVFRLKSEEENDNLDPAIKKLQADMVLVEGGTFTMGWLNKERDGEGDDRGKPAHEVTLDDFYIGRYEVTQAQWRAVMGSDPSHNKGCDDCPVEKVSWNDVQDFLEQLNKLTGQNYRLPTEAEWEFAARGGNQSQGYLYSGSNNIDEVAWYDLNYKENNNYGEQQTTHPVGQKKANELGLFDMSGNVYEWCQDWYGDYPSTAQRNPKGPSSGSSRVRRGGCWSGSARYCRVTYRGRFFPVPRYDFLGFRVILP